MIPALFITVKSRKRHKDSIEDWAMNYDTVSKNTVRNGLLMVERNVHGVCLSQNFISKTSLNFVNNNDNNNKNI